MTTPQNHPQFASWPMPQQGDTQTQAIAPGGMVPPGQPATATKKPKRFGWLALIAAFILGICVGYILAVPTNPESGLFDTSDYPDTSQASAPADPGHTDPADPVSPKPQTTRAQAEALESAESYLDSGAFSKRGLLEQLTSSYGEDFDKKDAQWAIAHVDADYKAEAVEAAESYLESGHFSRRELTNQLTSSYGEGFTKAEADYAVAKVYDK